MSLFFNSTQRICFILLLSSIFVFCFHTAFSAEPASARRIVRVGFFPFPGCHITDADGKRSGYGYDYLQSLTPYVAWDFEYSSPDHAWPEMLSMLESGKVDLVPSVKRSPDREQKFAFSRFPMGVTSTILTTRIGNPRYKRGDYAHWNGIRVGLLRGSGHNKGLETVAREHGFTFVPVEYSNFDQLLSDLRSGINIDAAVSGSLRILEKEVVLESFDNTPFYIAVRKNDTALLNEVNSAMEQLDNHQPHLQRELWHRYFESKLSEDVIFTDSELEFIRQCRDSGRRFVAVINPDRRPLSYMEHGKLHGIMVDILTEMLRRSGIIVKFRRVNTRAEYNAACADSSVDIILDMVQDFNLAESSRLVLTQPYFSGSMSILRHKDSSAQGGIRSVALVKNSDTAKIALPQLPSSIRIVECNSYSEAINLVAKRLCDAAYMYTFTAEDAITQDRTDALTLDSVILTSPLHSVVAVRKSCDPRLVSILNKAATGVSTSVVNRARMQYFQTQRHQYSILDFLQRYHWYIVSAAFSILLLAVILLWCTLITRKSAYRIGALFTRIPLHCFVLAQDGRIRYHNFGGSSKFKSVRFRNIEDIPDPAVRKFMRDKLAYVLQSGRSAIAEFPLGARHRAATIHRLPDSMFGCPTVLWLSQDVSELFNSRAEARKNEEFCRLTLQSVGDAAITTDINGNIIMLNPVAERLVGVSPNDAVGHPIQSILKLVHAQNDTPCESPVLRAIRTNSIVEPDRQTDLLSLDGTRRIHVKNCANPIHDSAGNLIGVILIIRDMTQEYRRRDEQLAQIDHWNAVSDFAQIYLFRLNVKTRVATGSKKLYQVWPFKNGVAVSPELWVHPADLERCNRAYMDVANGVHKQTTFDFRSKLNGSLRYFRIFIRKATDSPDEVTGLIQELTKYVKSQEQQESLLHLWQICFNVVPAMMFIKSADSFRYLQCNESFARFFHLTPPEIVGHTDAELFGGSTLARQFVENDKAVVAEGKIREIHETGIGVDGKTHYVLTVKAPARDIDGRSILIGMAVDETKEYSQRLELQNALDNWEIASRVTKIVSYRCNTATGAVSGPNRIADFWPVHDGILAPASKVLVREDVPNCVKQYHAVVSGKTGQAVVKCRMQKPDGLHFYRIFMRKDQNFPDTIIGIMQDVTQFVLERREKEALNNLWHAVADAIPAILFVKDADNDYRYIYANNNLCQLFHRPVSSIIGHLDSEFMSPDDIIKVHASDRGVIASGRKNTCYETIRDSNGVDHHFHSIKIPSVNEAGHRILIQMTTDVTELQELSEVNKIVSRAFEKLFFTDNLEAGVRGILKSVCEFIGFSRGYVCYVDTDKKSANVFASFLLPGEAHIFNSQNLPINPDQIQFWNRIILDSRRGDVWEFDFSKDDDLKRISVALSQLLAFKHQLDIRSAHIHYLEVSGKTWGFIIFLTQYSPMKHLSDNEKTLVNMAAYIIELAIGRKRTYNTLQRAMEDANAAAEAKSNFLATMSHEIRTPLNAVLGFADLLNDPGLTTQTRLQYQANIAQSGNALLALINDILDLSKLSANKMIFSPTEISLAELIHQIGVIFQPKCMAKKVEFICSVPPDFPSVWIDRNRIRQILFNLIGNAVKFTDSGSITVSASFTPVTSTHGTLRINVIDSGIGISQSDIAKLAQPFSQAQGIRGTATANSGTGLGLVICKKMLECMNGELFISSTLGKGTTMSAELNTVRFGAPAALPSFAPEKTPGIPRADLSKYAVLIVDDVPMNVMVLKAMLNKLGIQPHVAGNADEALICLEHHSMDFILTDLWMPGLNGVELARHIRRLPADPEKKLKIAVLTADIEGKEHFDFSIFDAVLTKPVTQRALFDFLSGTSV